MQHNKFTFTLCPPDLNLQRVPPENIYTHSSGLRRVIGNFNVEGRSQKLKLLKESMNQNWNFKRDG